MGFEPMVPASERAKTVQALDRSVTVTGELAVQSHKIFYKINNQTIPSQTTSKQPNKPNNLPNNQMNLPANQPAQLTNPVIEPTIQSGSNQSVSRINQPTNHPNITQPTINGRSASRKAATYT
jgi:hypothetical protein